MAIRWIPVPLSVRDVLQTLAQDNGLDLNEVERTILNTLISAWDQSSDLDTIVNQVISGRMATLFSN